MVMTRQPQGRWRTPARLLMLVGGLSVAATVWAAPPTAGETRTFKGVTSLVLERVSGEVTIETRDAPTVEVESTHPGGDAPRLELRQDGAVLRAVMTPSPAARRGTGQIKSTVDSGTTHISVEGEGNTVITQVGDGGVSNTVAHPQTVPPLHLTLRIPKSAALSIRQGRGEYRVGDLEGFTEVILSQGNAVLGHLGHAALTIDGAADIQATGVQGDLTARVDGSGSILVHSGHVGQLTGSVSGAGDIRVLAETQKARLSITGAGDIEVSRLKEEPEVTLQGAGSVRVNGQEYDGSP